MDWSSFWWGFGAAVVWVMSVSGSVFWWLIRTAPVIEEDDHVGR